jgi:hypothetical protein
LIVLFVSLPPKPSEMLMNRSTLNIAGLCLGLICGFALISLSSTHALAKETPVKRLTAGLNDKTPPPDEKIQAGTKKYLGVPYKRAGASKKGFDCSGFVKVIYDEIFGINLPHQSSQQSLSPELVRISLDSLRTGDLVFFSTSGNNKAINHVGIYLSDGKFIHAARSRGVVVSELDTPYWRSKLVGARRPAGMDQVKPERGFLDLALFFDRQNALFFRYEKNDFFPFTTLLFENHPIHSFEGAELHRMEFEFMRGIHPSLISHFTVFRETLLFSDDEKRLANPPIFGSRDIYESKGAYAQGLRLAGSIRPSASLSVTPSLSYLEYGPSVHESALPKLVAGLHFNLLSSSNDWSLSTGLRMPLSRYPSILPSDQTDDHTMDIALTYRQRLSNRTQLSLSGEKYFGFIPGPRDSHLRPDTDDQKLTLMLHFFY